ncbi:Tryptophan 2,3-dioxygenase [Gossypium arboreum]|uniref:Uncharacterized protein n=2 Tax=Gossypium arboreum TaxID=29729 RepID=A0ABR0PU13_GOSAR|nr:hypothetical protein PVK06_014270 [Gossypium arboreum]KHG25199.1 Tryptophan 2,3-dioxygenase [Gossypium arboreum]
MKQVVHKTMSPASKILGQILPLIHFRTQQCKKSLWRNKYQLINPSVTLIKEVKMQLLQVENVFYHARGLNSNDLVSYLSPKMDLQGVKLHWEETKIPRLQSLLLPFVYYIFRNKFKKTSHFI